MSTRLNTPAPPPKLATLHTRPSWHNRAGRVDRSACFTLTASQLWRRIPEDDWTYRLGLRPEARGLCTRRPQASSPKPHHFGKCDRYATHTLYARDLWLLHKWQNPYPLQGDFRTAKSNALCAHPAHQNRQQTQRNDPILGNGPINPNRGVGFNLYKILGLDCMWSTTLTICRIVQHQNLKQHFLVCPVCGPVAAGSQPGGQTARTRPSRRGPTATNPALPKLPLGRVTKLYLPLCTQQERDDARLAQLWLKNHTHPNRPWSPAAVELINRYGELFDPPDGCAAGTGRQLRCRHCLGLRYGEKKPPKAANGIGGLTRERAVIGKTADPIGGFDAARHLTEQQLFLTNLPKLLAKPRGKPRRFMLKASNRSKQANTTPNQSAINKHQSPATPIDTLPESAKLELLRLFTAPLPAFKKLAKAKQPSEHDA